MGYTGLAGGGGVIRDSSGRILQAFGLFYGVKTSIWAEAKATLEDLQMACNLHFSHVWLELDSTVHVDIITGKFKHLGAFGTSLKK